MERYWFGGDLGGIWVSFSVLVSFFKPRIVKDILYFFYSGNNPPLIFPSIIVGQGNIE